MLSKITIVLVCICHFKNIIMLNIVMHRPCYTAITRGFLILKTQFNSGVELSLFFSWAILFLLGIIAPSMCNSCKASSDILCLFLLGLLSGWVWGPSGVWYYHLQTQNYLFLTLSEGKTTMYYHFSILGSPWQIWCHHGLQRWHFWKPLHIFFFLNA